jgi:hypothetical protein
MPLKSQDNYLFQKLGVAESEYLLFPDNQVSRQRYFLCFASKAIYIIMPGYMVIKLSYKGTTYASTLLVDRVQKRIRHILDTLENFVVHPIWL